MNKNSHRQSVLKQEDSENKGVRKVETSKRNNDKFDKSPLMLAPQSPFLFGLQKSPTFPESPYTKFASMMSPNMFYKSPNIGNFDMSNFKHDIGACHDILQPSSQLQNDEQMQAQHSFQQSEQYDGFLEQSEYEEDDESNDSMDMKCDDIKSTIREGIPMSSPNKVMSSFKSPEMQFMYTLNPHSNILRPTPMHPANNAKQEINENSKLSSYGQTSKEEKANKICRDKPKQQHKSGDLPNTKDSVKSETEEDPPTYRTIPSIHGKDLNITVTSRRYKRIMKRREAKAKLLQSQSETQTVQLPGSFRRPDGPMHGSRSRFAKKRPRDPNGRFYTKEELKVIRQQEYKQAVLDYLDTYDIPGHQSSAYEATEYSDLIKTFPKKVFTITKS